MNYEVWLKYHQDDATGEWGFAHKNTISNEFNTFNAFWSPEGIFHDVFEHYFEGEHKYFENYGFMTIFGEACASGHAIAYYEIGIDSFKYRKFPNRDFTADSINYLKEFVYQKSDDPESAYIDYPACKNNCLIPYQKPTNNYYLENTISDYLFAIRLYMNEKGVKNDGDIWLSGITRAYRYGYRQAKKIIGKNSKQSYYILNDFLIQWNNLTKQLNADNLYINNNELNYILFKIKQSNGKLKIKVRLIDYFGHEYNIKKLNSY
jgi:hypothetical protein